MGTHPIFESDFDCLTDFEIVDGMNSPHHERLEAIKDENERIKARKNERIAPEAPPPPMDWPKANVNPRMQKLRRFDPGRVTGSKKKSALEQVSMGEGTILRWAELSNSEKTVSKSSESSILMKSSFLWISSNQHVTSYLQGSSQPMCGLAASLMAAEIMKTENHLDLELEDFLECAQNSGFTKQGEMFKAEDLASLAVEMLNVDAETIYGSIDSNYEKIISHLMSGNPWLIPHDADHDHRPTNRNGEKSHWGLVTGFLTGLEIEGNQKGLVRSGSTKIRNFFLVDDWRKTSKNLRQRILNLDPKKDPIFLFAKQGRAPGLKVWDWSVLSESNAQLFEFNTSRFPGDYLLPEGGVREGLNLKSVLLKPK